eukprot:scaffold108536_cov69-Phaeocystis_antarctica.AAC.2
MLWAGSVRVWLASASFEYVGAYGDAALPGEACWLAFYILSDSKHSRHVAHEELGDPVRL